MATETTTQQGEAGQPRARQALEREGTRPGPVFRPDVDIVETRDAFLVSADLPGADERQVDVRLERGVLSIDAVLAVEPDPSWRPIYREYRSGGYHREFSLTDAIDAGGIQASLRDGVLEIRLPKTERHRPRQIAVETR